jgi:hypothetical protein
MKPNGLSNINMDNLFRESMKTYFKDDVPNSSIIDVLNEYMVTMRDDNLVKKFNVKQRLQRKLVEKQKQVFVK